MGNKKISKVPLDRECLMEALEFKRFSIRGLGEDYRFGWSSKSVERGIRDGVVSPELMEALGKFLDVDTDYLSGRYHRQTEKVEDEKTSHFLKSQLKAKDFPYFLKQQRNKYSGKILYDRYIEYILVIHNISMHQFDDMLYENQKEFQLDLEDAITSVLIKHFPRNAMGQDHWPDIYRLKYEIDTYDPDEHEI